MRKPYPGCWFLPSATVLTVIEQQEALANRYDALLVSAETGEE